MKSIISFEGIDGCGKSTQIKLLSDKLNKNNIDNIILREPGDTDFSNKIRNILLDTNNEISSISEMFLFLSARAQLVKQKIIPYLDKNYIVLLDRYVDSTLAYQGYGRKLDKNIINQLNLLATNQILPDLTFIFKIDPMVCIDRIKNSNLDRMESSGIDFLKNVSNGYMDIASQNSNRCKILDCTDKDIEVIHNEIVDIYSSFYKKDSAI
tara:strand:- start:1550 stop:2179 length:630 start_codon:yes stop_codon:yes gene_type:complete